MEYRVQDSRRGDPPRKLGLRVNFLVILRKKSTDSKFRIVNLLLDFQKNYSFGFEACLRFRLRRLLAQTF
jgi:hypothetical protein